MNDKEEELFLQNELGYFIDEYKRSGRLLNEKITENTQDPFGKNSFFDLLYRFPSIHVKKEKSGSDNDHASTFFVANIGENKYSLKFCMLFTEKNTGYVRVFPQFYCRIKSKKEQKESIEKCVYRYHKCLTTGLGNMGVIF